MAHEPTTDVYEIQVSLNILAGNTSPPWMDAQAAANVYAGTKGLDTLGALNVKAGTKGKHGAEVSNILAGTKGFDMQAALSHLAGGAPRTTSG